MNPIKVLVTGLNQTYALESVDLEADYYSFKAQSFITFLQELGLLKRGQEIPPIDSITISYFQKDGLSHTGSTHSIKCS